MRIRFFLLAATAAAIPLSFVEAPYPEELVLQHVPTVLGLAIVASLCLSRALTRLSFLCVTGFLWLHIIGARWIYSFVPYDEWLDRVFGFTLADSFGWQRNHYDRLVHFASGLLGVPLASEMMQRHAGTRPMASAITAVSYVLAVGALYEVLEWQIAMTFSPSQAEAYNGQQGDIWDPQKDLALAAIGAMISAIMLVRWRAVEESLVTKR